MTKREQSRDNPAQAGKRASAFSAPEFIECPSGFLQSPEFTPTAKVVYLLLKTLADSSGVVSLPHEFLCARLGIADNTFRKSVRELQAARLVEVDRVGMGACNRYYLSRRRDSQRRATSAGDGKP